jgi:hypothetical protein
MAADQAKMAANRARKAINRRNAAARKAEKEKVVGTRTSLHEDVWGVKKAAKAKRGMTTAKRQEWTVQQALLDARKYR